MLTAMTATAAVVVIAFAVAIVVGEWWILPVALLAHAAAFLLAMRVIGKRVADDTDKPDPVTEARLEEESAEHGGRNGSRKPSDEPRVFGH